MRGRFITIEGVEGSGKTTHGRQLADALSNLGYQEQVALTREPGGTRAGAAIRVIVLDPAISLESMSELLLMLADRAQHVSEHLKPALKAGKILISDRYSDSTMAYQGYGRGFDLNWLADTNRRITEGIQPDLTFLLDCPPEVGLKRARGRNPTSITTPDRFEGEQLEFHQRVREGFLAIARDEPARVKLIDSTRAVEQVSAEILTAVIALLERP
jgi:dTMP kinase